eukprot:3506042-Pyramimonas_sp.AAC.1
MFQRATTSKTEGGWLSKCDSRLSAAHIRINRIQQCQGPVWLKNDSWSSGTIQDRQDATVMLTCGVAVLGTVFLSRLK